MNTGTEKPVFTSCNDCTHQRHIEEYDEWGCIHEDCRHYPFIRVEHFEPKQKKIIDMSKLVGSNIDMEFRGASFWWVDKLKRITSGREKYIASNTTTLDAGFSKCRIRQDHWHYCDGGICPLPEGLLIEVKTRNDGNRLNVSSYNKPHWEWGKLQNGSDIIAFKVKGAADGWKYGWDK